MKWCILHYTDYRAGSARQIQWRAMQPRSRDDLDYRLTRVHLHCRVVWHSPPVHARQRAPNLACLRTKTPQIEVEAVLLKVWRVEARPISLVFVFEFARNTFFPRSCGNLFQIILVSITTGLLVELDRDRETTKTRHSLPERGC